MNRAGILFLSVAAAAVMVSTVAAAGDAVKGEQFFNDPHFAGAVRACSYCHPGGGGLEGAADRKVFHIAGGTQTSLEEAVNACIVNAAGGHAIDPKSAEMKDMVAYIKSLKKKQPVDSH